MFKGGIELSESLGPCKNCVFRFNEILHNPKPCNVCIDGCEFVPDDDETPTDGGWLNDPETCAAVINLIDDITYKVDALNEILPNRGIDQVCLSSVCFLKALKGSIVDMMIKGFEEYGGPCYSDNPCYNCQPNPGIDIECYGCQHNTTEIGNDICPF